MPFQAIYNKFMKYLYKRYTIQVICYRVGGGEEILSNIHPGKAWLNR